MGYKLTKYAPVYGEEGKKQSTDAEKTGCKRPLSGVA
jgi:hypothetical protein